MELENGSAAETVAGGARRASSGTRWRHRIAAMISAATTSVVPDFAFAMAAMYPELHWPTLECGDQRDPAGERLSGRRAGQQDATRTPHSHVTLANGESR